jgi:hypothetical protein
MALMASTDFRNTDITVYVPFSPLAAGITILAGATSGIRAWQTPATCKILAMKVVCGSGTVGATATYTAAYDGRSVDGTVVPTTVLANVLASTSSALPVLSTTVTCPIDVATTDNLPPTIPAGVYVGFNNNSVATNHSTVCGVLITYRFV